MIKWIIDVMELYGYIGIFLMMALENVFPPIPSEVILLFGGFMTTYSNMTAFGVFITATTGSLIGAMILYAIGSVFSVNRLEKVIDKWGKVLSLSKEDLWRAENWFQKYGYSAVLFCRMIPLVRSLISIPAGMSQMRFSLFVVFTMIGTCIWNVVLISTGVILGVSWQDILYYLNVYATIVYLFIGISIVLLVLIIIKRKYSK